MSPDRLSSTLLVADEVIHELRLDHDGNKSAAIRRLKLLREYRKIDFIRVGHRTNLYPRAGVEKFKKRNLVEATA